MVTHKQVAGGPHFSLSLLGRKQQALLLCVWSLQECRLQAESAASNSRQQPNQPRHPALRLSQAAVSVHTAGMAPLTIKVQSRKGDTLAELAMDSEVRTALSGGRPVGYAAAAPWPQHTPRVCVGWLVRAASVYPPLPLHTRHAGHRGSAEEGLPRQEAQGLPGAPTADAAARAWPKVWRGAQGWRQAGRVRPQQRLGGAVQGPRPAGARCGSGAPCVLRRRTLVSARRVSTRSGVAAS